MIKAYLTAITTLYEGEDIEIRYNIFKDEVSIKKETVYLEYIKPAIVGLVSVLTLLKNLEEYKEEEILVILNDASLYEIIKGTSTTKNVDIIKMATKTKELVSEYKNINFVNIIKDKKTLNEWNEALM